MQHYSIDDVLPWASSPSDSQIFKPFTLKSTETLSNRKQKSPEQAHSPSIFPFHEGFPNLGCEGLLMGRKLPK